jgi:hypothetical protein
MANFAIYNKTTGIVENVILADTLQIVQEILQTLGEADLKEGIEYTEANPAKIGDTWNGEKFITPITTEIFEETDNLLPEEQ